MSELLMGITQMSIAFVGISAIVEVVRERAQRERSQLENLLARKKIEFGFSALFLALLPLLVSRLLEPYPESVWPALAALLAIVLAVHLRVYSRRHRRVNRASFLMPAVYRARTSGSSVVVLALASTITCSICCPSGIFGRYSRSLRECCARAGAS